MKAFVVSIFSLTCFILAGYMAFQQFKEYFNDQDSTRISRHRFKGENDYLYPTMSICLKGKNGKVFDWEKIKSFSSMPLCRKCKKEVSSCISNPKILVECTPKDYFLAMSGKIENINITSLPFGKISYDARKFVVSYNMKTWKGTGTWTGDYFDSLIRNGSVSWLLRKYQDPQHICIQKDNYYQMGRLLRRHYWKISIDQMLSGWGEYDIRIFVHQKGQLLRNLGSPNFVLDSQFLKNRKQQLNHKQGFTYKVDLQVNAVDVLHKRKDSFKPCNDSLYDEDAVWIQNVIRLLNCTPSFLQDAYSSFGRNKINISSGVCSKEMLSKFDRRYAPKNEFETIAKRYHRPCTEMESTVTSAALIDKTESGLVGDADLLVRQPDTLYYLELKLYYRTQYYKLASNEKSFTLFTLWSQVGGFIGIFLGYSLLQLPELLVCASLEMKKLLEYHKRFSTLRNPGTPD